MKPKILYVEDDEICTYFIRKTWPKKFHNYEIKVTESGEEGLNYIQENHSSIVIGILDHNFKKEKLTGLDLAKKLRNLNPNSQIISITNSISYIPPEFREIFTIIMKEQFPFEAGIKIGNCLDKVLERILYNN